MLKSLSKSLPSSVTYDELSCFESDLVEGIISRRCLFIPTSGLIVIIAVLEDLVADFVDEEVLIWRLVNEDDDCVGCDSNGVTFEDGVCNWSTRENVETWQVERVSSLSSYDDIFVDENTLSSHSLHSLETFSTLTGFNTLKSCFVINP